MKDQEPLHEQLKTIAKKVSIQISMHIRAHFFTSL